MVSVNDLIAPVNPLIRALLRSPLHPVASRALLVLSWSGRTSGRRYSIPVGYQRDGDDIVVMLTKPAQKTWWKNFRMPWPAELLLQGRERTAMGEWVEPGTEPFFALVEKTLRGTAWMAGQLGLEDWDPARGLTPDQRAIVCEQAGAVRFELTD